MKSAGIRPGSGRFLLRVPGSLHARLQEAARGGGLSLNEYCSRRLSVPGPDVLIEEGARSVVDRARTVFADRLIGMLAYGSYVRGDAGPASDVDLLMILDRSVPLTRGLYCNWDATPLTWLGRPVDPHFVHLPAGGRSAPGAWCEAALTGVVLIERDGAVTRCLAAVRGDIASGRLVRRTAHGQPYWTEAA
jgi:predicted nucleotidyltransferase